MGTFVLELSERNGGKMGAEMRLCQILPMVSVHRQNRSGTKKEMFKRFGKTSALEHLPRFLFGRRRVFFFFRFRLHGAFACALAGKQCRIVGGFFV